MRTIRMAHQEAGEQYTASVKEAVQSFMFSITHHSIHTQRFYGKKLEDFAVWCEGKGYELSDLKPRQLSLFTQYVTERNNQRNGQTLSDETVKSYIRAVKTFMKWCSRDEDFEDFVTERTANRIQLPHVDKKLKRVYSSEEIGKLLDATKLEVCVPLRYRDHAIVSLLLYTGIRAGELCGLTLDCVFISSGGDSYIRVKGKGRKEREISLCSEASKSLYRYIHRYRRSHRQEVFIGYTGNSINTNGLAQVIERVGDLAGLDDVHCHKFRHTFAVNFMNAGGSLFDLQRILGHTNTTTTSIYLQAYTSTQARKNGITTIERMYR